MEVWRLATGVATWRNGGKYELATGVVPEVLNVLEVLGVCSSCWKRSKGIKEIVTAAKE